jgi:hypothetical protein
MQRLISAHFQWARVGIDLRTNQATPEVVHAAARKVLDSQNYRMRAKELAQEFASHVTEGELLRRIEECIDRPIDAWSIAGMNPSLLRNQDCHDPVWFNSLNGDLSVSDDFATLSTMAPPKSPFTLHVTCWWFVFIFQDACRRVVP